MRVCCLRQVCAKAFLNQNDTLHVAGATLFYRVRGSGPTLLILPGGDGDADTTKTLCDELVDHYTVVTYDRRGLSRSTIDGPVESLTLGTHSEPSNPMGVPVWSHDGIICTGETYKDKVKLTFAKGASLEDPAGLFNTSLEGNARRAIDLHEGDEIDESAFKSLVRAAAALNASKARGRPWRPAGCVR
jgi:hypothetical protein